MKEIVGKAAVFVKKQVETDVFEGQERDGRRRGGRMEGEWRRMEGGQREDVPEL